MIPNAPRRADETGVAAEGGVVDDRSLGRDREGAGFHLVASIVSHNRGNHGALAWAVKNLGLWAETGVFEL